MAVKAHVVGKHLDAWRALGREVGRLLLYVALNLRALRKVVKKQRKLVRSGGLCEAAEVVRQKMAIEGRLEQLRQACGSWPGGHGVGKLGTGLVGTDSSPAHYTYALQGWPRLSLPVAKCVVLPQLRFGRSTCLASDCAPCSQVGALEPGSYSGLQATLIIQHPHEPDTKYTQGSFLKKDDIERLDVRSVRPLAPASSA